MIKDSIYTFISRFLIIVGKVIYSMVVNRTLGVEGKGLFELLQLTPNTLTFFGTFGFNESNIYFSGKQPDRIPNLIGNSYFLTKMFSLVAMVAGAGFLMLPANRGMFESLPIWVGFLALASIPIALLDLFLESILYGENRIWIRNVHELLRIGAGIVFMGILVFVLKMDVAGAVYGFLLIQASLLLFSVVLLSRFHRVGISSVDRDLLSASWQFAKFSWGANFASFLLYKVDVWLIFQLATEGSQIAQVGLYSTAVSIVTNVWFVSASVNTALLPKITQKGESERQKLVPPSMRMVSLAVTLAIAALIVFGKAILGFLYNKHADMTALNHHDVMSMLFWNVPDDFTPAYIPLVLLMPGIYAMALAKLFAADFFSRGKPRFAMWISILAFVINFILNLILIPCHWMIGPLPINGMNGAAIASSIAYTVSFLVFLHYYIRESGEKARNVLIPQKSDFILLWSWILVTWNNLTRKSGTDEVAGDD